MFGFRELAKERLTIEQAIAEAEKKQPPTCMDNYIETDYCIEIREEIVRAANEIIEQYGTKKGLKKLAKALKLRSTYLLFDPSSYASPRLPLWDKKIEFHKFEKIVQDNNGAWGIVYSCTYSDTIGWGQEKIRHTSQANRILRFDYRIMPETNVSELFS